MYSSIQVIYSPDALKDLKKLEKKLAVRIVKKISDNAKQKDPLQRTKALGGGLVGRYRYRIGDYRAIFRIDADGKLLVLMVLRIKHRKDVYK